MKEPEKWIFHKGSACGPTEAMKPELNPEWVRWNDLNSPEPTAVKVNLADKDVTGMSDEAINAAFDSCISEIEQLLKDSNSKVQPREITEADIEAAVDFVNNGPSPFDFVWRCSSCDMSSGKPCPHCNFSPYF